MTLRRPGRRIDLSRSRRFWSRRQPLDVERAAVRRPVDAGEIDVGVGAEVDLDPRAAVGGHDPQLDDGVRRAGGGVALGVDPRPVGADRRALDDLDPALVDPLDRDARVGRRPPRADEAVEFLLRDELGRAPADRLGPVVAQRRLLARGEVEDEGVAVADERREAALGRQLRVGRRRRGQLADRCRRAFASHRSPSIGTSSAVESGAQS